MATIWIPPLLQDVTQGQKQLTVPGETVRDVIAVLERDFPGIESRLIKDGRIHPGISVVVDSEASTVGLLHRLSESSEVHFLPALSGG